MQCFAAHYNRHKISNLPQFTTQWHITLGLFRVGYCSGFLKKCQSVQKLESNTPMPRPTPRTTPNHSSDGSRTFAQLCRKLPTDEAPHICPKINTPSRGPISEPNYLPHPWIHPTYHSKRHTNLISRFATMHRTVIHMHRQTDQWMVELR